MNSNQETEETFYLSIKGEIDSMMEAKLHSLYKNKKPGEKVNSHLLEGECEHAFFNELTKKFDGSIKICKQFYEELKQDDLLLYDKIRSHLNVISEKLPESHTFGNLLELNKNNLSIDEKKKIDLMGLKHFEEEKYDKAYLYFSFLSLIDSGNARIWLAKGMIEQNLGKFEDALNSYSASISLAPQNLITYIQIIDTLLLMKHFAEAQHVYETFIREADPEDYSHNAFIVSKLNTIREYLARPLS